MKLIVGNIATQAVVFGKDHLIGDVHTMLREELRVRPNGYHQIMLSMKRRGNKYGWDGYTYFLNKKGFFPTGFLPLVIKYCLGLGLKVTLEDKRINVPLFKEGDWNWLAPLGAMVKHQRKLIKSVNNYVVVNRQEFYLPRGIWDAATNSRKTAAFGSLINNIENPCALLIVNDQGLLNQHLAYYKTVFTGKDDIGVIKSTTYKIGKVLTIAMVRTLYNRIHKLPTVQRDLKQKFNVLGVDEGHDFAGKESVYVINHVDAGVRLLMSGSPLDMEDKVSKLRLVGMFGTVLHTVTKRYLMDNGFSLIPKIFVHLNPTKSMYIDYPNEFRTVVTESEQRADLIADLIMRKRKKKILITFNFEEHGQFMYETFCQRYPSLMLMAACVHGDDPHREVKIKAYIDNKITILFSSTILQQGYNIVDIRVIINAMGGKASIPINQFMGRGERLDGIETHFEYHEIFDQGRYMTKHSKKRLVFYRKLDLPEPITYLYKNRKGTPIK